MIVKTHNNVKAGDHLLDWLIVDQDCVMHQVPFLILREVTKEEFIQYWTEMNCNYGTILPNDRFYLISVD